MPPLPELAAPLTDGVVALRLMAERDIPEILIAHEDDPLLHVRLGAERPPSGAELGRRCEQAEQDRLAGVGVDLTVVRAGEDVCLGTLNVHHFDPEHARAELGLWVAPGERGRGYGARALRLAAGWLFAAAGLARIELRTEPANAAMLAAARAAGFREEGVLRGYTLERGRRMDNTMLSLLPGDS